MAYVITRDARQNVSGNQRTVTGEFKITGYITGGVIAPWKSLGLGSRIDRFELESRDGYVVEGKLSGAYALVRVFEKGTNAVSGVLPQVASGTTLSGSPFKFRAIGA